MSSSDIEFVEVSLGTSVNFFEAPEAGKLFTYWRSHSRGGELPRWEDFELDEMPTIVPNLTLIRVDRNPLSYVTTMTGTTVVQEIGSDNTSAHVHELSGGDAVAARFNSLLDTRRGYFVSNAPVRWASNDFKKHSALMLPLCDAEGTISHIVGWVGNFV